MNNTTKFKLLKPAHDVFEAFVDPAKIGNFWFSTSSERWEPGKRITLTYEEYNAKVEIEILEIEKDQKIVFQWGANGEGHVVTISLIEVDHAITLIEVVEEGFNETDSEFTAQILDNKEGWVFMLTCLKGYLEAGISTLRGGLAK